MTHRAPTTDQRTRPTARVVLLVLLSLLIYGAGTNIGAGSVLMLAAGMVVGTAWSVTGFLRRVGDLRVLVEPTSVLVEGATDVPLAVTVPRGVIGVLRVAPTLPRDLTGEPAAAGAATRGEGWSPLPRSGTSAQVHATTVLARGDAQQLSIEVEATDLFGLVRRRAVMAGPVVDVIPSRGAPATFAAETVEGAEDEWIAHALAANGPPATELRSWRPGEGVRAVHWAASERVGELLVRPRGPETTQRRTLAIEDRDWTRDELDARCRDLVATADRLAHAGVQVEVAVGGQVLPWSTEAAVRLARLRPNATDLDTSSATARPRWRQRRRS